MFKKGFLLVIVTVCWTFVQTAHHNAALAQGLLRDSETEAFIRKVTRPLFEAAGLVPEAVNIYLINDPSPNAFVTMGQSMFIHSGLILNADNLNQVLGVLAHETGHMSGGHFARSDENATAPTSMMLLSLLLGAAALAAGSADAGLGLFLGGQTMAQRTALKFSRSQESAADQAAATFLNAVGASGKGLMEFFAKLRSQEMMLLIPQNPYVRTHPLNSDRILNLRHVLENSPYFNTPTPPDMEAQFQRIKAKLAGYSLAPRVALLEYPEEDQSIPARYARVYAYNNDILIDKSLAEAKSLIKDVPDDPYFQEIAGQIYFENGKVEQSLPYYRKALELKPNDPLMMTSMAHALSSLEQPDTDQEAADLLDRVVMIDRINDFAWRLLATIQTRLKNQAEASYASAEMFLLYGQYGNAIEHAERAAEMIPRGSPKWLRTQDILISARQGFSEQQRQMRRQQRRRVSQ